MRSVWIIAKKELKTYLYFAHRLRILTASSCWSGFFFYSILSWANEQTLRMQAAGIPHRPRSTSTRCSSSRSSTT